MEQEAPILPDIGYRLEHLLRDCRAAIATLRAPLPQRPLSCAADGGAALLQELCTRAFFNRRPSDEAPYAAYLQERFAAQAPLHFRFAFGPLKNVNLADCVQRPDLAEFLTLAQLRRFYDHACSLYPYGIIIELLPDDCRARHANLAPSSCVERYISGLQRLGQEFGCGSWLRICAGQAALYSQYQTADYFTAAAASLQAEQEQDAGAFAERLTRALRNAGRNLDYQLSQGDPQPIAAAAWRYMVAHRAEILSGMWSTSHTFPVVFAQHDGFQSYTLGYKKTKLPWQIQLPYSLVAEHDVGPALGALEYDWALAETEPNRAVA